MSEITRLERLRRRAEAKGDLREVAGLTNLLGQKLQEAGDLEGALDRHRQEAALCQSLGDAIGVAVSHRRMGEVLCEMGLWDKALGHQGKHLELAREAEDPVEEQRAHATIGRTHLRRAEALAHSGRKDEEAQALTEAERSFLKSLSTCERLRGAVDTREHSQMRCRLYLNLGLVLDSRGMGKKACHFIGQALDQCHNQGLHEDAQRCHSALGAIHLKEGHLTQALQEGHKSLALSAKLHDKALQCDGHAFLAQVHLVGMDYSAAKKCLYRAHRLKHPDPEDRQRVERNLKAVVVLCRAEDSLILEESEEEKLKLYEKLGDRLADLSLYSQALGFYHKMLQVALKAEKGPSFLAPIYLSLARTYSDDRQFREAKSYYQKEYDIRVKEDPREACRTLISIAHASEELKETFEALSPLYERAKDLAERGRDPKLQVYVLRLHSSLQGIGAPLKAELEAEVERLIEENDLDPEALSLQEEEEDESDKESLVDLDLDLVRFTDSEDEQENFDRPQRSRRTYVVKRNEKGESPLHIACIAGNLSTVRNLLLQGHPVNPRDNCGWLPLHEASNHGFYDIVLALIEAGAWVNDRGGQHCEGVTPLHDAASCGNLEVVRLLVARGASVTCRTNDGDTPLECLAKYRRRTDLSPGEEEECLLLERELKERMEKAGHKVPGHDQEAKTQVADDLRLPKETEVVSDSDEGGESRRSGGDSDEDLSLPNPLLEELEEGKSATGAYLSAIKSLGSGARRTQTPRTSLEPKKDRKASLLSETSVGEDWLEDDMGIFRKKRKRPEKSEFEYKEERRGRGGSRALSAKKPRQTKLTSIVQRRPSAEAPKEEEASAEEPTSASEAAVPEAKSSRTWSQGLRLKVRVENRLLLVPVAGTGLERRVGWLAEEVTRRYYQLSGRRPHLTLATQDGAVLDPDDPVSLVLPEGQAELRAQVTGWDLPPLPDRYLQACQSLGRVPQASVTSALQRTEASASLDLGRAGRMTSLHLQPLLRSLQCQETLRSLVLSTCRLGDEGFQHLMEALPSLPSLGVLHLSSCAITTCSLLELTEAIASSKVPLKALNSLDLSYNCLSGAKTSTIGVLLDLPSLTDLRLRHCGFDLTSDRQVSSEASSLQSLCLDYNAIQEVALASLLSRVPGVSTLTLSGLRCPGDSPGASGLGRALTGVLGAGEECHLRHLDLSSCHLTDNDLDDLCAYLYRCPHLTSLDLSHNPDLTSPALTALLDQVTSNIDLPLTSLGLHGTGPDLTGQVASALRHKSLTKHKLKSLSLTASEDANSIENLWKSQYQGRAAVKRIGAEVFLTCSEI